ncbi:unnamed protein product, partial [Ectocarpus sp. 12 AP-2014]
LHNAALEAESGARSPADCGTCIGNDLRVVLGQKPQRTAFDDDDSGVLGGSSDGASDASGSEAGHESRVWVCGHCTKEHLLQMEEKAAVMAAACDTSDQSRLRNWKGGFSRGLDDDEESHFRAWTLEVVGVDGLTIASRTVRNPQALSTGNNGKTSSASDATWHPCLHQYQYRVVVTVIQDMAPVGIESSAPPVQLFRF